MEQRLAEILFKQAFKKNNLAKSQLEKAQTALKVYYPYGPNLEACRTLVKDEDCKEFVQTYENFLKQEKDALQIIADSEQEMQSLWQQWKDKLMSKKAVVHPKKNALLQKTFDELANVKKEEQRETRSYKDEFAHKKQNV